jgi:hypothetical protein
MLAALIVDMIDGQKHKLRLATTSADGATIGSKNGNLERLAGCDLSNSFAFPVAADVVPVAVLSQTRLAHAPTRRGSSLATMHAETHLATPSFQLLGICLLSFPASIADGPARGWSSRCTYGAKMRCFQALPAFLGGVWLRAVGALLGEQTFSVFPVVKLMPRKMFSHALILLSIRVDSKIANAQVNAQPSLGVDGRGC